MRILLQCTIPHAADDWHIGRFSLLAKALRDAGHAVVARDLAASSRDGDPILSRLSRDEFDELWLLGVDGGQAPALSPSDISAVNAFHRAGGGLLTTRDHENMGVWLRQIDGVGRAHYFHASDCCEPDADRRRPDDLGTATISWPNYHSGANGDFQHVDAVEPLHPLLAMADGGRVERFPAHPHEGAVGVPPSERRARAVARGRSATTGRTFELVVAFERDGSTGRAIAESSFHHFADYNWDQSRGAPSFVTEPAGDGMRRDPRALEDIHAYVANAARWLAPVDVDRSGGRSPRADDPDRRTTMKRRELGPATIHTHACGEGGIFVNAYLIESRAGVVAVDATLSESESKALRKEVEAIGKPLLAVLVTHPHPDHVAGITNLVARDSPAIIATEPVLDLMRKLEEPKRAQWAPVFGAEWVARWTYPNTIVRSGEKVTFDGVTYSVLDVGAGGDSEANSVWFLEGPKRTAFLSDLTFNGTHAYVADGYLLAWLANLSRLDRLCPGMEIAFPGHGEAAAPAELIGRQRAYLLTLAGHVKELANGRSALSADEKTELERRMSEYLPGGGLAFLIGMSADPIARELNAGR